MALSYEQFMEATGAELVAGNIIVGIMSERKKVGALGDDGVFSLNDDGKALAEQIEAAPAEKATRRRKSEAVEAPAETDAPAAE
ncbi:hypothetical protein EBT31_16025 [bacterium]|nr:hypothetical protein [bacterium]